VCMRVLITSSTEAYLIQFLTNNFATTPKMTRVKVEM
jgi:hypothetical protein